MFDLDHISQLGNARRKLFALMDKQEPHESAVNTSILEACIDAFGPMNRQRFASKRIDLEKTARDSSTSFLDNVFKIWSLPAPRPSQLQGW